MQIFPPEVQFHANNLQIIFAITFLITCFVSRYNLPLRRKLKTDREKEGKIEKLTQINPELEKIKDLERTGEILGIQFTILLALIVLSLLAQDYFLTLAWLTGAFLIEEVKAGNQKRIEEDKSRLVSRSEKQILTD